MTKDYLEMDEMLNSYLDGELSQRKATEVQRLIAHDVRIARRFKELERCKMLVQSLPSEQAPVGMLEDIKASLERKTLLEEQPIALSEGRGVKELMFRKVFAAAAMIGLVAALGAVIYTILTPRSPGPKPAAISRVQPIPAQPSVKEPEPTLVAAGDKQPETAAGNESAFKGTLEVKTKALLAIDAAIKKAIERNGLSAYVSIHKEGDKNIYALSCRPDNLRSLLVDLKKVWPQFDSSTFFVQMAPSEEKIAVANISSEQALEILGRNNLAECFEQARKFAVANRAAYEASDKESINAIADGSGNLITPPKPLLTSGRERIKKPTGDGNDEQMDLTIIVADSK